MNVDIRLLTSFPSCSETDAEAAGRTASPRFSRQENPDRLAGLPVFSRFSRCHK
ncbi:hypothetical protein KDW20_21430 [Burkholderia cenocepacia]|uniref:hypothetical protein n=1 Tax=Burkholderia cenocepacia TaxID=95486 RepID=UPI001B977AF3|nr:hypothetical protein [Burkholderia cenocepacia]MBR8040014.1 hypothetical protein [Burkholderia cenocepacia]MBR8378345.1 hypothetical protein [Burkholderia cenocepacia]